MALVTENQIDELLREKLRRHGVSREVKDIELLATPEGILAEVVLLDASVLDEARKAVEDVERELEADGVRLAATVRALWQVEDVQRVEIATPPGVPSDAVGALFKGTLKSGARRQEVWVSVTPSAQSVLRPLTTADRPLGDLVRAFLQRWLSVGGVGYWDPTRDQKLELDEGAASYVRWRPYEQLRGSIDLVFRSPERAKGFLRSLEMAGGNARDFDAVLRELPSPGGSIARGERFPTSNRELYKMLLESEKMELEQYYFRKLDGL